METENGDLICDICGKLCRELTYYTKYTNVSLTDRIRNSIISDKNEYCDVCFAEKEREIEDLTEK